MKKIWLPVAILAVVLTGIYWGAKTDPTGRYVISTEDPIEFSPHLSPENIATDTHQQLLYVTLATGRSLAVVDAPTGKVKATYPLPKNPTGVALAHDGKTLYVTMGGAEGGVAAVEAATGEIILSGRAGHTPGAPVVSPDGKTLYVGNRFNNDVSVLDTATLKERARIPVRREPVALLLRPDGKRLFAANLLPAMAATEEHVAAVITVIDTESGKVAGETLLPNGSTGVRGLGISPDGRHIYATHSISRYQLPTTQLERGWMNTSALSVLNADDGKWINTVLLDDVDQGAANPWGVACAPDGKTLVVAHAGTHEISLIDREALHARLDQVARGEKVTEVSQSAGDVPNDLSFLVGFRRRIPLPGNGPRGVAILNTGVYAAAYFSDALIHVDPPNAATQVVELGPRKEMTAIRRGEMLWNDATMCFQHWQSCATCHPDGRVDGLNWDLLNDGLGNPKQTKSMVLSYRTPPAMISGVRSNAMTATRAGITFIQLIVRPEADALAIDEYLASLKPTPSPWLEKGRLSEQALRGARIFEKASCAKCHPPLLYTDMNPYHVGLGDDRESGKKWDTPTLVEVWRTAPYLYDGRAATMMDVLTKHNHADLHGLTSHLAPEELEELCAFVLSL